MRRLFAMLTTISLLSGCSNERDYQNQVQAYLDAYTAQFKQLSYANAKAEWNLNTRIVEGDSTNAIAAKQAKEELARFTGSVENIEKAREYLKNRDKMLPLQMKQLEAILFMAADNPQTVPELVKQRIAAETEQTEKLFGFDFKIDGKPVSTNDIDRILKDSASLEERLKAWESSKEVGMGLKDGLENVQRLRNETVRALDYSNFFSYQVSEYGMKVEEMMALMEQLNRELRPLYRELHTYARYTLAKKYKQEVPDQIPAHWLPNRWGQDWSTMVTVEGLDLDGALKGKTAEWIVKEAEQFYVSLGFEPLPPSFYELSSLYPLPEGAQYKKNNHASAWHMDLVWVLGFQRSVNRLDSREGA